MTVAIRKVPGNLLQDIGIILVATVTDRLDLLQTERNIIWIKKARWQSVGSGLMMPGIILMVPEQWQQAGSGRAEHGTIWTKMERWSLGGRR